MAFQSVTIAFPRPMKRGPKVRRGPCAQVITHPSSLSGDELARRWLWLSSNRGKWDNDNPDGMADEVSPQGIRRDLAFMRSVLEAGGETLDEALMRREVAKWRGDVAERVALKSWLASMDVDTSTPTHALYALFELMGGPQRPRAA